MWLTMNMVLLLHEVLVVVSEARGAGGGVIDVEGEHEV
jgi:hypothetical protein